MEKAIYDLMTPSAAGGLLETIYWHPGMKWGIDHMDSRMSGAITYYASVQHLRIGDGNKLFPIREK